MSPQTTESPIDALFEEPVPAYTIHSALYSATRYQGFDPADVAMVDETPPLGFTEALLHGAGVSPILAPGEAVIPRTRAYQGPIPEIGPGRIIDGGSVELFVNTLTHYDSSVDIHAGAQAEPEFFMDKAPDGIWYLIPDADRLAWNDWCNDASGLTSQHVPKDEHEHLIAPDFAKRLPAHPRWTVFKSPRQKFS